MNATAPLLAVNSNPRNLELLAQFLNQAGYQVISVDNLAAFDAALDHSPQVGLALVDISGFDHSIWLRCERLQKRDIPLLVISSKQSSAIQQESLAHGARSVLVKPLVVRDLLALVRTLLDQANE